MSRPLRILVARHGSDDPNRAAENTARVLRDAGVEVIYTGLHQTPALIGETALQEDVDAIGVSVQAGTHMTFLPAMIEQLNRRAVNDVTIFVGGDIPPADAAALKTLGVAEIFTPGTQSDHIVQWLRTHVRPRA